MQAAIQLTVQAVNVDGCFLWCLHAAWDHFADSFCAHIPNLINLCCCYLKDDNAIWSQLCTSHDSWAVVVCAKLWPNCIIRIKISVSRMLGRFQLWAPFGEMVPKDYIFGFIVIELVKYLCDGGYVNIGLDNGCHPCGTKPSSESMLTNHKQGPIETYPM